ncbi:hypothetical protein B0A50_01461 [Salinomyces thailandicus]|uniref:Uncharacterized protein n=1 Tax=Salinomyces thailandicus TaxID=706561 RepID=A0A4U0UDD9_9PEZI|nr:hypothetical protein B0A50_01461 [Salinomyces thailandica]
MPALPGESLLTTLFADIHYYFTPPTATTTSPPHSRFTRASYLYLYHHPSTSTAKLEIANHPGTPAQDAFSGSLAAVKVGYSYKQPTLFTLHITPAPQDGDSNSSRQWHVPAYDPKGEQKYLYPIDTLDVYLWTEKDAASFLRLVLSLLSPAKLDIRDAPPSADTSKAPISSSATPNEHRDSMSPLIQHLESTALNPVPPRTASSTSTHSYGLPGPPTPATSAGAATPASAALESVSQPAPSAAPAYNPAAPAAPEFIAHREKTPPPPLEGEAGTELSGGVRSDTAANPRSYFSSPPPPPPPQQQQQQHYQPANLSFPGPPSAAQSPYSANLPPPPPPPASSSPAYQPQHQQQQKPSPHASQVFPGTPSSSSGGGGVQQQGTYHPTSPPAHQQSFPRHSSFNLPTQAHQSYGPLSPAFAPSLDSPGLPPSSGQGYQYAQYPSQYTAHQQQQQQQPPPTPSAPPAYGMQHAPLQSPGLPPPPPQPQSQTSYNYNYSPAYTTTPPDPNAVHAQLYRPSEAETAAQGHGYSHRPVSQPHSPSMDEGVSRGGSSARSTREGGNGSGRVAGVEKRVGGFLRRLDRLI